MFGQTVTASGDTMRQHRNARCASPRKWMVCDIECDAGCGVVPFRYREQSYVNALQWAIGLELFLLVRRPVARGADHRPSERRPVHQLPAPDPPADGPQLPRRAAGEAAPGVRRRSPRCGHHARDSLYEIAIMTRAAPARLLGLADRGHLGAGAAADIAVYREQADREAMFATPRYVFKDGAAGRARRRDRRRAGRRHALRGAGLRPRHRDDAAQHYLRRATRRCPFAHFAIGDDELLQLLQRRAPAARRLPCARGMSALQHQRRRHRRHLRRSLPDEGDAPRHHRAQRRLGAPRGACRRPASPPR